MRLVLRVTAASVVVMTYVAQLCAQTGFANIVDHLHLAAPDPIKAVEWYRKNLGGQPTAEGTKLIDGIAIFSHLNPPRWFVVSVPQVPS